MISHLNSERRHTRNIFSHKNVLLVRSQMIRPRGGLRGSVINGKVVIMMCISLLQFEAVVLRASST
jgi:hypothetical protein